MMQVGQDIQHASSGCLLPLLDGVLTAKLAAHILIHLVVGRRAGHIQQMPTVGLHCAVDSALGGGVQQLDVQLFQSLINVHDSFLPCCIC